MFGFLGTLLIIALLSFGGVAPVSTLALNLTLSVGLFGLVLIRTIRREALDFSLVLFLAVSVAVGLWVSPRLGVPMFVGVWAFAAVRDSHESRQIRFLQFLLCLGLGEALLGLAQNFVVPGWIFGYINVESPPSGTLINRNHFAGLLEMLFPASVGLAYVAARRHRDMARSYVYLIVGAIIALALIFSTSRMGIVSLFAAIGFMFMMVRTSSSHKSVTTAVGFCLIGLILSGALWIGVDVIIARYGSIVASDAAVGEARIQVYRDSVRMIIDNPWGVGVDQFRDVFRQYQTSGLDLVFDHAHNDYLESMAEWGILPALLFWMFVYAVLVQSVRGFLATDSPELQGISLAVSGAIFSILLHSLTDFNLQIPSNAMLFCVFVGFAVGTIGKVNFWWQDEIRKTIGHRSP